jgi:hypothetical protein
VILVDSSVWIDYFRGNRTPQSEFLHGVLGAEPLIVGDLILAEVLQGFRRDRDFDQARRLLEAFDVVSIGGRPLALQAAQSYRVLQTMGITVHKTINTFIATFCIEFDVTLLFSDRDFNPFVRHLGLLSAA